jgi:hypothetical protein
LVAASARSSSRQHCLQARRIDGTSGRTRKLEAHALELADRLAKLLAVVRVADGLVERALGETDHLSGDADPTLVKNLDGDLRARKGQTRALPGMSKADEGPHLVALADLADDICSRDDHVVETELAGR